MNYSKIEQYISEGYISAKKHPHAELYIYNYTAQAHYEGIWTEETMMCRGLIMDNEQNIIARPFEKFFNLEEEKHELPKSSFEVFEKMDGSLGILYFLDGKPHLASRCSFTSEQAMIGTEILQKKYAHVKLNQAYTYLFEIIYPENRIVVDYGQMEDIVLLGTIETKTGKEIALTDNWGFKTAKRYNGISDIYQLKQLEEKNKEGFIVRFENGFRVKVKFEEYVRLHSIITNINSIAVWESLQIENGFDELIKEVPDELYHWVDELKNELLIEYKKIEDIAKREFRVLENRKETAFYFKQCSYPHLLFLMYDKKNYDSVIWQIIRPVFKRF